MSQVGLNPNVGSAADVPALPKKHLLLPLCLTAIPGHWPPAGITVSRPASWLPAEEIPYLQERLFMPAFCVFTPTFSFLKFSFSFSLL